MSPTSTTRSLQRPLLRQSNLLLLSRPQRLLLIRPLHLPLKLRLLQLRSIPRTKWLLRRIPFGGLGVPTGGTAISKWGNIQREGPTCIDGLEDNGENSVLDLVLVLVPVAGESFKGVSQGLFYLALFLFPRFSTNTIPHCCVFGRADSSFRRVWFLAMKQFPDALFLHDHFPIGVQVNHLHCSASQ